MLYHYKMNFRCLFAEQFLICCKLLNLQVNGGTFQAVPVNIQESSYEEQLQTRNNYNVNNTKSCPNRKMFLDSMLKAENVSKDSFARIDMVRNHRLQDIKDFDETKKQKQIFQSSEMEKKLQEFQARKTIEEDKQKQIEFPILNEVESVKEETNRAEDTTVRDKSKKKETEVLKEKEGKGGKENVFPSNIQRETKFWV